MTALYDWKKWLIPILFAAPGVAGAGERPVSFPELLTFANQHAPEILLAAHQRGYGQVEQADTDRVFRSNPILEMGLGPRFERAGDHALDYSLSLQQPLDGLGTRRLRKALAKNRVARLEAELAWVRWELRHRVQVAYFAVQVALERHTATKRMIAFSHELVAVAKRRQAKGDGSGLDVLDAEIDLAKTEQAALMAEKDWQVARVHLAEITGWAIESPPQVPAGLPLPHPIPPLATVLRKAEKQHPRFQAQTLRVMEAKARTTLADREAWPSPVVGVEVTREGAWEGRPQYTVLGTLGMPLPVWQRNQNDRAKSRVDETIAQTETHALEQRLLSQVTQAHLALESAVARLELLAKRTMPLQEENLNKLRRGFEAGEITRFQVTLGNMRHWDSHQDLLNAYADAYQAAADLELAIGAELPTVLSTSNPGSRP